MVIPCCVPFCPSKKGATPGVSFHNIPSDMETREKWIRAISRAADKNNRGRKWASRRGLLACGHHFVEGDFVFFCGKRLKKDAVPSVFQKNPSGRLPHLPSTKKAKPDSISLQLDPCCFICQSTINPGTSSTDNKTGETGYLESVLAFLVRILLEIPESVLKVNEHDNLRLEVCEPCSKTVSQAKQIYSDILDASRRFRNVQKGIVNILKKKILDEDPDEEQKIRQRIGNIEWQCRQFISNYRYDDFGYPFIVKDSFMAPCSLKEVSSFPGDFLDIHIKSEKPDNDEGDGKKRMMQELWIFPEEDENNDNVKEDGCSGSGGDSSGRELEKKNDKQPIERVVGEGGGKPYHPVPDRTPGNADPLALDEIKQEVESEGDTTESGDDEAQPCEQVRLQKGKRKVKDKRSNKLPKKPLQCRFCKRSSVDWVSLRTHIIKRHRVQKRPHHCVLCDKACKTRKAYSSHMQLMHSTGRKQKKKFPCPIPGCTMVYAGHPALKDHLARHAKTPRYKCSQCDAGFYHSGQLKTHKARVHDMDEYIKNHQEELKKAEEEKRKEEELKRTKSKVSRKAPFGAQYPHIICNPNEDGKFPCLEPGCKKIYPIKRRLHNHLRSIHLGEKFYTCSWPGPDDGGGCSRTFTNSDAFKSHVDKHKGTPRFKCEKCNKAFYSRNPFDRHRQTFHEGGKETRPFVCEVCGKKYSCMDYLYNHKSFVHNEGRKNNKSKIENTSSSSNNLEGEGEKLPCHVCGKFYNKPWLNSHLFKQHDIQVEGYSPPCTKKKQSWKLQPHKCLVKGCSLRYSTPAKLDEHIKLCHSGGDDEGWWKCKYCGKGYHRKEKLRLHEESHENWETRPFKCEICGKGFSTRTYLTFHKKHTHKMKMRDGRLVVNRQKNDDHVTKEEEEQDANEPN